jgi:hypothetical protein
MNIHEYIDEKVGLVKTYAKDGAFHSAARILGDLAEGVKAHAISCDEELTRMLESKKG